MKAHRAAHAAATKRQHPRHSFHLQRPDISNNAPNFNYDQANNNNGIDCSFDVNLNSIFESIETDDDHRINYHAMAPRHDSVTSTHSGNGSHRSNSLCPTITSHQLPTPSDLQDAYSFSNHPPQDGYFWFSLGHEPTSSDSDDSTYWHSTMSDLDITNMPAMDFTLESTPTSSSETSASNPPLSGPALIEYGVESVCRTAEEAGFANFDQLVVAYYTGTFKPGGKLAQAQTSSRRRHLRSTVAALNKSAASWDAVEARGMRDSIIKAAEKVYVEELKQLKKSYLLDRSSNPLLASMRACLRFMTESSLGSEGAAVEQIQELTPELSSLLGALSNCAEGAHDESPAVILAILMRGLSFDS